MPNNHFGILNNAWHDWRSACRQNGSLLIGESDCAPLQRGGDTCGATQSATTAVPQRYGLR